MSPSKHTRLLIAAIAVAVVVFLIALGLWPETTDGPADGVERSGAAGDASGSVTWNYSAWGAPRAATSSIETAKTMLEEASGGRFRLNIVYASALAPAREGLDAVKLGAVESAMICAGYHPNKLPLATAMELPMLLTTDVSINARVIDEVMQHPLLVRELAEKWNARYLKPVLVTRYEFMGNTRIASAADLQGVRMRISGANARLLEKFGAVPTMVTAPETYTALQRGTLDVVGLPYAEGLGIYRIHEVAKYTTDGLAMSGFACFSVVSLDAWVALPDDLKQRWPEVKEAAIQTALTRYAEGDDEWIPVFQERLDVVPFPAAERAKLMAEAEPIWEEWVTESEAVGLPAREILTAIQASLARHGARR